MERSLIAGLLALLLASPCYAQEPDPPVTGSAAPKTSEVTTLPIVVDLAEPAPQIIRVDAGTYQLTLMNAVPGRTYWLHIGPSFAQEIPVLSADGLKAGLAGVRGVEATGCLLTDVVDQLIASRTEVDVRKNVEILRVQAAGADPKKCPEEIKRAAAVMALTSVELPNAPIIMTGNAIRRLSISSRDGGRWGIELNSMGRGTWQTTYGFAFNPNNDEEYFSEAGAGDEFTVRKQVRDSGSLTFLPAVFFTWLPSSQALKNIQHGPTVGVGVTAGDAGGRFGALAGYSLRFNQNIGMVAGVSVYQHRRLNAQYKENQVITENLAPDQLNEDSLRPNVFLALTLRFGSSPFTASTRPEHSSR